MEKPLEVAALESELETCREYLETAIEHKKKLQALQNEDDALQESMRRLDAEAKKRPLCAKERLRHAGFIEQHSIYENLILSTQKHLAACEPVLEKKQKEEQALLRQLRRRNTEVAAVNYYMQQCDTFDISCMQRCETFDISPF